MDGVVAAVDDASVWPALVACLVEADCGACRSCRDDRSNRNEGGELHV
jgi:hypothetical protein